MKLRFTSFCLSTCFSAAIFSSTAVFAAPAPTPGAPKHCLDSSEVAKIRSQFHFLVQNDADGHPAQPKLDICNENSVPYLVLAGIQLMETLPALNSQSTQFSAGLLKESPARYFKERVKTIVFDAKDSEGCTGNQTAAYVQMQEGPIVHVCPQNKSTSILWFTAALIHEARHLDGDGYSHSLCQHGAWAGIDFAACDPNYEYKGSYGAGAEFNAMIAKTEKLKPELREEGRAAAISAFLSNFNEAPFGIRSGIGLVGTDSKVSFFDGQRSEYLFTLPHPDDQIYSNGLLNVVSSDDGTQQVYEFRNSLVNAIGRAAKPGFVDFYNTGAGGCVLFIDKIHCVSSKGGDATTPLAALHPRSLLMVDGALAVSSEDGYSYRIPIESIGNSSFTAANFQRSMTKVNMLSLLPADNGVQQGLGVDGIVRTYRSSAKAGEPVALLSNSRYRRIIGPLWFSQELGEL